MRTAWRMLAALGAALACAGAASAQLAGLKPAELTPAQTREINCVRDGLSREDAAVVVAAYFEQGAEAKAAAVLTPPARACRTRHGWSDAQMHLSETLAQNIAIVEELTGSLAAGGLKDRGALDRVWSGLPATERTRLLETRWANDSAFLARLQVLLIDAGVPNKPDLLTDALIVLEATSHAVATSNKWAQSRD